MCAFRLQQIKSLKHNPLIGTFALNILPQWIIPEVKYPIKSLSLNKNVNKKRVNTSKSLIVLANSEYNSKNNFNGFQTTAQMTLHWEPL